MTADYESGKLTEIGALKLLLEAERMESATARREADELRVQLRQKENEHEKILVGIRRIVEQGQTDCKNSLRDLRQTITLATSDLLNSNSAAIREKWLRENNP